MATTYEIDGNKFSTLEEFYDEVTRAVIPGSDWGRSLDAFNDILRGGFGTPDEGFTIRWVNHAVSRVQLGYPETVRQLELRLQRCHPSNRAFVSYDLAAARAGSGSTVFDWLVELIQDHGENGTQREDRVSLELA